MRNVAAGALLAATLSISACTAGGSDPATEPTASTPISAAAEPPLVLGPLGETEAEFETDEGSIQIGSAEIPDVVSGDFPLPADLDVQLATESGTAAGFNGVSQVPFEDLVEFYERELPAAGYEVERSQFVDGVVAVFAFSGSDGAGEVVISSAPGGGRSVLVTFES